MHLFGSRIWESFLYNGVEYGVSAPEFIKDPRSIFSRTVYFCIMVSNIILWSKINEIRITIVHVLFLRNVKDHKRPRSFSAEYLNGSQTSTFLFCRSAVL